MEDHRGVQRGRVAAGDSGVVAVVSGAGLVFGAPHVVEIMQAKRAAIVLVDGFKAGSVAHVNGRVVTIDSSHDWVTVPDDLDGIAYLVESWFGGVLA